MSHYYSSWIISIQHEAWLMTHNECSLFCLEESLFVGIPHYLWGLLQSPLLIIYKGSLLNHMIIYMYEDPSWFMRGPHYLWMREGSSLFMRAPHDLFMRIELIDWLIDSSLSLFIYPKSNLYFLWWCITIYSDSSLFMWIPNLTICLTPLCGDTRPGDAVAHQRGPLSGFGRGDASQVRN